MKDDWIERPETYLGAQLSQKVTGGVKCWTMTSEQSVKAAIANVEAKLCESQQRLPSQCVTPMQANYRPKPDVTAEMKIEGSKVTKRLRDSECRPIGTASDNPLIDTRKYIVEFTDGHSEALSANLIAWNCRKPLVVDGDPTMAYKEWKKTVREFRINQTTTEPYSPWQNRAELDV